MATAGIHDSALVSVVVPCYRQAHFLPQAIESVLGQNYPHVEILVVDDGSPDETRAVAARYPGVRCWSQGNRGLSAARNAGFRETSGGYVVFLDADDRLTPDALAAGVGEMMAHPECALVAGDHRVIDERGAVVPSAPRPRVSGDHYRELLKINYIWCPASAMYRRSVIGAVGGFDTALRSAEDYDMYLRIARRFPIRTHATVVVEYRVHPGGMSRSSGRMLRFSVQVLRNQRRHVRGDRVLEEACAAGLHAYRMLYGMRLITEIADHLRERRWRNVVRESLVALRYHPQAFVGQVWARLYRTIVGGVA